MEVASLKKNAALNVIKTLMSLIFPLITFPYVSRILLPDGLGKINFARAIMEYFVLIASLGISLYGTREVAKVRDDAYLLSKFSKEIFIINMGSTVFAYLLFFISLFTVPKFEAYRALLCVFSATILFTTIGMDWLYNGVEDFYYITVRYIAFNVLSLILLFMFVHSQKDYLVYAFISVLASTGANILNFIHSRKYIDFSLVKELEFRKHIKPVLIMFAMALTIKIYTVLDTTMLGFICSDWHVGIYSAAVKINKIILALVVSASTVLLPRLSYYSEQKDQEKFNAVTKKGLNLLLLVAIPCAAGLCLLSPQIISLLSGDAYSAAVPAMRIMNPIILMIGVSNFIGLQLFMPLRKEKYTLYSVIWGAAVNFTLNLVLIPRYQVLGAAISTLVAETVVTAVQLVLARDIIDLKAMAKIGALYLLNAAVMSVFVYMFAYMTENALISFILGVVSGVIVYMILLLLERNEIAYAVIKAVKRRFIC